MPNLYHCSPVLIGTVSQTEVIARQVIHAPLEVKPTRQFIGKGLILHELVLVRKTDCLVIVLASLT